jgi:hypothetical protein
MNLLLHSEPSLWVSAWLVSPPETVAYMPLHTAQLLRTTWHVDHIDPVSPPETWRTCHCANCTAPPHGEQRVNQTLSANSRAGISHRIKVPTLAPPHTGARSHRAPCRRDKFSFTSHLLRRCTSRYLRVDAADW